MSSKRSGEAKSETKSKTRNGNKSDGKNERNFQLESTYIDDSHEGGRRAGVIRLLIFMAGLLLGGLTGGTAMLLMAPRSGKRTRQHLQRQSEKMRLQAAESMSDIVADAGEMTHQFTESVQESVHKGVGDMQQYAQELLGDSKK